MRALRGLSQWLIRVIKPVHLAVFMTIFVAFLAYVLPQVSAATELATGSERSPDMSFFYTAQSVYEIAQEYGAEGRSYYIVMRLTFDVVWPIVYTLFLVAALSRLLSTFSDKLHLLNLLPILGMVLDYLENIALVVAMSEYPNTTLFATVAPYFTVLKWVSLYAAFGLLFIGIPLVLIKKIVGRKK